MKSIAKDKKMMRLLLELSLKQPWVIDKLDELENLMFSDCKEDDERELLFELIDRFEYLSNDKYDDYINMLGEEIATEPGIDDNNTQIVAMAADSGADSSQYILVGLKFIMQRLGWEKHKFVNTFGKAFQTYKNSNVYKNIILVDEFVGSGQTVINRVKTIKDVFNNAGVTDYSVMVKVLVSTEHAYNKLINEGISISPQLTIKKGISDCYDKPIAIQKLDVMRKLEAILQENINGKTLPSLGYGESESLYCRESGNVPNNVFPIFWWPRYIGNKARVTILTRAIGDL